MLMQDKDMPLARAFNHLDDKEKAMHALKNLFTSGPGLMTVAGLSFMLGMGVFFIRYFFKHMREDGERAAKLKA